MGDGYIDVIINSYMYSSTNSLPNFIHVSLKLFQLSYFSVM